MFDRRKKREDSAHSCFSPSFVGNWLEIGGLESVRICETFRLAEIDVLINADETFLRFYPEEEHVIAPEGSKRVGSTNETLKEDSIYNSLVKNQQACELTF